MPVHRNDFSGRAAREFVSWPESHQKKRQNAAQKVKAVRGGENVEKAAGRIGCKKKSGGGELAPGDYLTDQKENSEDGGDAPPVTKARVVVCEKATAGTGECEAASNQNQRVQPKNARDVELHPGAVGHVLADNVGAHQRHEKHKNAAERDDHSGNVSALRHASGAGRTFPIVAASTEATVVTGRVPATALFRYRLARLLQ